VSFVCECGSGIRPAHSVTVLQPSYYLSFVLVLVIVCAVGAAHVTVHRVCNARLYTLYCRAWICIAALGFPAQLVENIHNNRPIRRFSENPP
jgi:hypothetical protein